MTKDQEHNLPLDSLSMMRRVRIVLVRPQVAGNIGAVARAMENFAASQLVLVNPERPPTHREALERSTRGQHRLHAARVVNTLEEALAGAVFAIGTSRRRGPVHQREDLFSYDLGRLIAEHSAEGDVALLFGTEDNGLSREELLACDAVVQIPAWPEYPTLNLSHAVTICLYEAFLGLVCGREALTGGRASCPPSEPEIGGRASCPPSEARQDVRQRGADRPRRSDPADLALMERLMAKLQHALLTIGYLHAQKPDHLMFPIRSILSRASLTRGEAQILMGLAQQIDEFARYGNRRHPDTKNKLHATNDQPRMDADERG